jgi:COP9 signalosome complex subunit 6
MTLARELAEQETDQQVCIHPLVVLNITDHFTRFIATAGAKPRRVVGALLGQQSGRRVEVHTSFEVIAEDKGDHSTIDAAFTTMKRDQYKEVFPNYDIVGWYSTGSTVNDNTVNVTHRAFMEFDDGPLFVLLDTAPEKGTATLPLYVFETLGGAAGSATTLSLRRVPFTIESEESERVGIDMAMHIGDSSGTKASIEAPAATLGNATGMLRDRIRVVVAYLKAVQDGSVPPNHDLLREISSLCHKIPCAEGPSFDETYGHDYDDALLIAYLGVLTKGTTALNDLVEKVTVAAERDRRRPFF